MTKTSRLARAALAAATLCIAGNAFAEGTWTPELGFGSSTGKHVLFSDGTRHNDLAFNAAFGYELDSGLGARAMAIGDFNLVREFTISDDRAFDNFIGVEVTDKIPLNNWLNVRGGVGVGRSNLINDQVGNKLVVDGALSLGLQWRPGPHYAMEVRVDHLTTSGTTVTSLLFQVPF